MFISSLGNPPNRKHLCGLLLEATRSEDVLNNASLFFCVSARFLTFSNRETRPLCHLGPCRTRMESPIRLSIFPGLPRSSCECICRTFFRHFSVSSLNEPWPRCNSSNVLNRLIIGLGYHWTDVSAACDGFFSTRAKALDDK